MKLFTVGPVEMYPETLQIEGTQLPYFRNTAFGEKMQEIEHDFLYSIHAPEPSFFIGLTCSGTGGMDAAVSNVLNREDRALVINGGSFGQRFAEICRRYQIPTDTFDIPFPEPFSKEKFTLFFQKAQEASSQTQAKGFTALLVNACDTSTCQLYDLDWLGAFCRQNHLLFIVDAVSAYLADPIDMMSQGIDILITASQKALALSPGVSLVALSEAAKERAVVNSGASYYFNFAEYIENQKRGQPPFTSAVGTMLALHQRLKSICAAGIRKINTLHAERAAYFRKGLKDLPVQIPKIPLSNCCTPVIFPEENALSIYEILERDYGMVLTPSGGDWKNRQLRVGHLGNLTTGDYDRLLDALKRELS